MNFSNIYILDCIFLKKDSNKDKETYKIIFHILAKKRGTDIFFVFLCYCAQLIQGQVSPSLVQQQKIAISR